MKRALVAAGIFSFAVHSACAQTAPSGAPGCDPAVRDALIQTAQQGAENSTSRVRNSFEQPRSVFDLSCLDSLFSTARGGDILYSDSSIFDRLLQMGRQAICSTASQAWSATNTRTFDANRYFNGMPGIVTPPFNPSGGVLPNVTVPNVSLPTINPNQVPFLNQDGASTPALGGLFTR